MREDGYVLAVDPRELEGLAHAPPPPALRHQLPDEPAESAARLGLSELAAAALDGSDVPIT